MEQGNGKRMCPVKRRKERGTTKRIGLIGKLNKIVEKVAVASLKREVSVQPIE